MSNTSFDPRLVRLAWEQDRLLTLNDECDYVKVESHPLAAGMPAEKFTVTFSCRGIVGLSNDQMPVYDMEHKVQIHCDAHFPGEVPKLDWLTPIWHPNVKHEEPRTVCVNKAEWLAGMGLDYLCWQMFDMVQYRNYHAEETPPFPQDHEVAKWVRNFAETQNIVNKKRGIYVDDRPFFKAKVTAARKVTFRTFPEIAVPMQRKVRFGDGPALVLNSASFPVQPAREPRIRFTTSSRVTDDQAS